MAKVVFYEKPGCGTNARQKRLLEAAGHAVEARSLLTEPWTVERLEAFFRGLPVPSWFNPAAPGIKSGAVDPRTFSGPQALALMVEEPLFIRRPLIEVEGARCAGFDGPLVQGLVGHSLTGQTAELPQGCSHRHAPCPAPAAVLAGEVTS
ncbi:arsenate reductase family protein [Azorhizobium oxalatiphilum]|uniref:Arsenate reductase family protein n=1 Tax=Azorhizobium oxalatiphilum TaxID=980631 RepID=A0A917C458_9HYPH|nr:arsenate reductase family protein [Azorhizobium oxalatiphilum]GGF67241.1 arsenate reductase family protein [Azorhizobium oxalatiphilum]